LIIARWTHQEAPDEVIERAIKRIETYNVCHLFLLSLNAMGARPLHAMWVFGSEFQDVFSTAALLVEDAQTP
jgi:hypothetical protein